jgi:meckelin
VLPDVSMWRSIMIANEWAEIQSERHTDIDFTLMFVLLFLAGLDYLYLSTPQPDVVDLSAGPTNAALRFFVIAMWYATVMAIQMGYKLVTYHFLDDPLDTFVDLCQLANVSVFILDGPIHGYYLHGHSVHPQADVNMRTMLTNHKAESDGNLPFRGLTHKGEQELQGASDLVFEMYLTKEIRDEYDDLFAQMAPALGAAGRPSGTAAAAAAESSLDASAKAYHAINEHLQHSVIEPIQARGEADIRRPTWTHRLLGAPPLQVGSSPILLRDNQRTFASVLFFGIEGDLAMLDLLHLAAWDLASGNIFVGALVTYVVAHGLKEIRDYFGKANISAKTLIDSRFLI